MTIQKILKKLWDEFIYGGHIQSLGAASIVLVSAILLKIEISWDVLLISYLMFYTLYLYNRWKEIEIDSSANPERTNHLKTYLQSMPIILYTAIFVLIGGLVYFSNLGALIFALLLLVLGLLYTDVFKNLTKKIVLFKNFYVAAFFASLVFFLLIYYHLFPAMNLMVEMTVFMLFVFIKAFMMQISLDLKDVQTDRKEGLLTLPAILGEKKTLNILKILSLVFTVPIPVIFSLYFNIFPRSILILLLTVPFNFYYLKLIQKKRYFGYILAGGEFLLWPVLILVSENTL